MPWQKFEALYEAHSRRQAVESVTLVRNAQISGVWANTNLDPQKQGEEGARGKILESIQENYLKSIKMIYNQFDEQKESGIDWNDPFFKAMKVPSNPYYKPNSPVPHDQNLPIEIDQN